AEGEVVASAGEPIDLQPKGVVRSGEQWEDRTVTLMNLVDLGTNLTQDLQVTNLTIVVPRHELTNRPPPSVSESAPPPPFESRTKDRKSTRLNSSHEWISYAVFCLKKKN